MQYSYVFHIITYVGFINKNIDNTALIESCRKGDREAMSQLYTLYAPKMLMLIKRFVANTDDAHDILHDGFVLAFTRLDSIRNPEKIEYWLGTIMRNLCIKFLQTPDMEQILSELPESDDLQEIEENLDYNIIVSLINTLPEGYRNVLRLAMLENKSHKEIAGILGIAPNSSASQLFRAKVQLRQLINNYRKQIGLLSFLLFVSSVGVLFFLPTPEMDVDEKNDNHSFLTFTPDESLVKNNNSSLTEIDPSIEKSEKTESAEKYTPTEKQDLSEHTGVSEADVSLEISTVKEISDSILIVRNSSIDSVKNIREGNEKITMPYPMRAEDYPLPVIEEHENNNWIFSLTFTAGNVDMASRNFDSNNSNNSGQPNDSTSGLPGQDASSDGDGNANVGNNDKDEESDKDKKDIIAMRGQSASKSLKDQSHHNHRPMSFSLTAQKRLNHWLAIETGLSYNYLHTTFEDADRTTECHWHYVGVPLKVNFRALHAGRFSFYGSLGGSMYLPVYSGASTDSREAPLPGLSAEGRFGSQTVWAIGVGIGISFSITDRVALYFEPTAQRYFTRKVIVPNLWSDEPWGVTFPIGIRFNW